MFSGHVFMVIHDNVLTPKSARLQKNHFILKNIGKQAIDQKAWVHKT